MPRKKSSKENKLEYLVVVLENYLELLKMIDADIKLVNALEKLIDGIRRIKDKPLNALLSQDSFVEISIRKANNKKKIQEPPWVQRVKRVAPSIRGNINILLNAEEILRDEDKFRILSKNEIIDIAHKSLGIGKATLKKMRKEEIREMLLARIDNIRKIDAIRERAEDSK